MHYEVPAKVLISGGHEVGGVASFAEGLRAGFEELGVEAEIVPPARIPMRWRELRDPRVLKILSTTAVFAAPLARRAICMAHGVPRADCQGWARVLSILASYKLANGCAGAQLVSVSHYTAVTLGALFNVRTEAVVHNPAKSLYLEPPGNAPRERNLIAYVGRLVAAKNLHRILPAIQDLLDEYPGLRMCVIGDGAQRAELKAMAQGDPRIEFAGTPDDNAVRALLRRTRVLVSGNEVEGFGIAYLEAMMQGCNVVMPASGGGLEIAPEAVGGSVQLMPLSWDRVGILEALRRALGAPSTPVATAPFRASAVAASYLRVDARFSLDGRFLRVNQAGNSAPSLRSAVSSAGSCK